MILPLDFTIIKTQRLRIELRHGILENDLTAIQGVDSTVSWVRPAFMMFGRQVQRRCETATFGQYRYRGGPSPADKWPAIITEIGAAVAERIGKPCPPDIGVANRYLSGRDALGWHTDAEASMGPNPTVATLSLGAERNIDLRVDGHGIRVPLASNSLLIFEGDLARVPHRIPPTNDAGKRISLSFRWKGESK